MPRNEVMKGRSESTLPTMCAANRLLATACSNMVTVSEHTLMQIALSLSEECEVKVICLARSK
jgi:hypothetical protein